MPADPAEGASTPTGPKLSIFRSGLSRWISLIVPLAAIGVAVYLLWGEGAQLLDRTIQLNLPLVGLSFVVECAGLLVALHVWKSILKRYGVQAALRHHFRIYSYSALGVILPGGIWSIVSRAGLYATLGARSLAVATASVVETLIIGMAALIVYAGALLWMPELGLWKRPEFAILAAVLALLLVQPGVLNRLINWALRKSGSQKLLEASFGWKDLGYWLSLDVVMTIIGGASVFVLLASLTPVSWEVFFPVVAAWSAAAAASNLLFWLPGTPLLRDGAMFLALSSSLTAPVALLFIAIVRLWTIASLLLLAGLVWLGLDLPFRSQSQARPLTQGESNPESGPAPK